MCSTVTKHFNRRSHRNHRALHAAMTYGFFQSLDKPHTCVSVASLPGFRVLIPLKNLLDNGRGQFQTPAIGETKGKDD